MPSVELWVAPTFTLSNRQHLHLVVVRQEGMMQLGVVDAPNRELVYLSEHALPHGEGSAPALESILKKNDFIYTNFSQTTVSWFGPEAALVPSVFFDAEDLRLHQQLVASLPTGWVPDHHKLTFPEAEVVFGINPDEKIFWKRHFLKSTFFHGYQPFLAWSYPLARQAGGRWLNLHLLGNLLQVSAWQDGQLKLANQYLCDTNEDLAYPVLLVSETLGWQGLEIQTLFGGQLDRNHPAIGILQNFLPNLSPALRPPGIAYAEALADLPPHRHLALAYTWLCAL
jgi:hypothetical protein